MFNHKKLWVLSVIMFSTACGCITGNAVPTAGTAPKSGVAPSKEAEKDILSAAKVGVNFQKIMLKQLDNDKSFTEAYGLFSEGGWSDDGQTWVLTNDDLSQYKVFRIAPNRDKPVEIKVNADAIKDLKKAALAGTELKAIEEDMFDGLIYEYTFLKKTGAEVKLLQNTYIKTTDITKHPSHEALVNAFKKAAP